jgi:hypothetical protein
LDLGLTNGITDAILVAYVNKRSDR